MATPSRPAYALADVVCVSYRGQRCLGEVVGIARASYGFVYDVSLEEVVLKAVSQDDVSPTSAEEVNTLLMALLSRPLSQGSNRDTYLRQRYVESLTKAMQHMRSVQRERCHEQHARFDVGQQLAMRDGSTWILATVRGVVQAADGVRYDVDALSEARRVNEGELSSLDRACGVAELDLGARARFVVAGYEQDDAYVGTICAIEQSGGSWEYAILFDDGDVLEGLSANDLIPA